MENASNRKTDISDGGIFNFEAFFFDKKIRVLKKIST